MTQFLIDILSFGAIISSILVITSKNPVIAVIFLISVFVNAAGYLLVLGIGFIGISYIIVYIGAITVLFLFVIMMINIRLTDILEVGSQYTKNLPLAFLISLFFIYEIFTILPFNLNNVSILNFPLELLTNLNGLLLSSEISNANTIYTTVNPSVSDVNFISFLQVEGIGQGLYTYGAIWLLICSMILLLAMLAPIFISKDSK